MASPPVRAPQPAFPGPFLHPPLRLNPRRPRARLRAFAQVSSPFGARDEHAFPEGGAVQTIVARAIQRLRLSCLCGLKSGREIAALKVCLFLKEVNEREEPWVPAGLDANENMQVRVARRSPAALEHQQGHDVARTPTPTFRLVKR